MTLGFAKVLKSKATIVWDVNLERLLHSCFICFDYHMKRLFFSKYICECEKLIPRNNSHIIHVVKHMFEEHVYFVNPDCF